MSDEKSSGFVHAISVPKIYKTAAKITRDVVNEGGSLKELIYTKVRANVKGTFAIVTKTIKNNALIETLIERTGLLEENPRFDPWLAKVLIAELLFGKGRLNGNCKPVVTVNNYKKRLQEALNSDRTTSVKSVIVEKPRYVRINTLRITPDEAIKHFRQEGWRLIPIQDSYDDFLDVISKLSDDLFTCDFHIRELLVFPAKSEFYQHPLYLNGCILLQDKISCLPPNVLNPESKSIVLDMCAAPGMKTTQLAALIRNKGRVIAIERLDRRFKALDEMVQLAGCTNVTTICGDSLSYGVFQSNDDCEWAKEVEYILVDPSCSGTGMFDRTNIFANEKCDPARIKQLSHFQFKLLKHALTHFPKARRVVYSTCSILTEENEQVVSDVLEKVPSDFQWELVPIMVDSWRTRGSNDYPNVGPKCLASVPEKDLTNGFFIALFERKVESSKI